MMSVGARGAYRGQ